jgi:hypothetical protein
MVITKLVFTLPMFRIILQEGTILDDEVNQEQHRFI